MIGLLNSNLKLYMYVCTVFISLLSNSQTRRLSDIALYMTFVVFDV